MRIARVLALLALLPVGACAGGGGGGSSGTFVLVSCSLGCTSGGCAVNQIAENQEIVLEFNREVDPASVGPESFQVVKAVPGGLAPAGTWVTQGKRAIFRPLLTFSASGAPSFGFETNAPYQVTVPAASPTVGSSDVIRSRAGSPNRTPLFCVVTASQGVNDVVPGPPHVAAFYRNDFNNPTALAPLVPEGGLPFVPCVPRSLDDTTPPISSPIPVPIVFVFDDIMQPASLVDPVTGTSGTISVTVRQIDPGPPPTEVTLAAIPGTFSISYDFTALVTRVVFVPSVFYPGLGTDPALVSCVPPFPAGAITRRVVISFSPAIFDLAGNPLVLGPNQNPVAFTTEPAAGTPFEITEDFDTAVRLDPDRTGALWNTPSFPGVLAPGTGGGRGLLGDLAVDDVDVTIDTSSALFPADQTLTNADITVTDGIFEFGTIRVSTNRRLRFVGPHAARVFVRGSLIVEGNLDFSGFPGTDHFGSNDAAVLGFPQAAAGGAGGSGGPAAGDGGSGGSIDPTVTVVTPAWSSTAILDGLPGEGVGGVGGNPNGGGPTGTHYPPNLPPPGGLPGQICPMTVFCKSQQRASGGGGAGYRTAGGSGSVGTAPPFSICSAGPSIPPVTLNPGGPAVVVDPTLNPDLGLLQGGAGGGGAGVHPGDTDAGPAPPVPCNIEIVPPATVVYQTGAGGGGGGGAAQVQAGNLVAVSSVGVIEARGGRGGHGVSTPGGAAGSGFAAGGGGGSGGAVLIQAGQGFSLPLNPVPLLSVRGGTGGQGGSSVAAHGGVGGDGYARIELDPAPSLAALSPFTDPPASLTVGTFVPNLSSPANFSGATSQWVDTANASALLVSFESFSVTISRRDTTNPNPTPDPEDPSQTIHIVYDDDPNTPNLPPVPGTDPIQIYFQGAPATANSLPDETQASPWVTSLADLNAFPVRFVRFTLLFDETVGSVVSPPVGEVLAALEVSLRLVAE